MVCTDCGRATGMRGTPSGSVPARTVRDVAPTVLIAVVATVWFARAADQSAGNRAHRATDQCAFRATSGRRNSRPDGRTARTADNCALLRCGAAGKPDERRNHYCFLSHHNLQSLLLEKPTYESRIRSITKPLAMQESVIPSHGAAAGESGSNRTVMPEPVKCYDGRSSPRLAGKPRRGRSLGLKNRHLGTKARRRASRRLGSQHSHCA